MSLKKAYQRKQDGKGTSCKTRVPSYSIAVNDELSAFEDSVEQAIECVKVGGRISVITFHSLEDRLCKQIFQEFEKVQMYQEVYLLFLKHIHLS